MGKFGGTIKPRAATPPGELRTAGMTAIRGGSDRSAPQSAKSRHSATMEVLHSPDSAQQRVSRTPRVFQSNPAYVSMRKQRELRSNLLPSILWTPLDGGRVPAKDNAQPAESEISGEFHTQYQEELQRRADSEEKVAIFLERDQTFPAAATDPQQIVAASCSVLKDLVEEKLTKFRRTQECTVNSSSSLPFMHKDQNIDLRELSDVLTLDLERRDHPFKDSIKRPGFLSLQLTSRLPLVVCDPVAGPDGVKLESDRFENDVHTMRVDLSPGEVRQVAYSLDNADFRATGLAKRMSAVIDPERSVLADLVRTLKAKESEAQAFNRVLSDILRDMPDDLPSAVEPDLENVNEEAKAARLKAMMEGPRLTVTRLVEVIEKLASLAQPLVPSLAHAFDRIALICVREVDRLAVRCHKDYESLFQLWGKTEKQRRNLVGSVDRMGGKVESAGGLELRNRVTTLHDNLEKQEQLYSNLLAEHKEAQDAAEEANRQLGALRRKISELHGEINELRRGRKASNEAHRISISAGGQPTAQLRDVSKEISSEDKIGFISESSQSHDAASGTDDAASGTGAAWVTPPSPDRSPSKEKVVSKAGESPSKEKVGSKQKPASREKTGEKDKAKQTSESLKGYREGLLSFTVPVATQTATSHYFNDHAPLAEEMTPAEFEHIMRVSDRLYNILLKYDWNAVASLYFLDQTAESDSDDAPKTSKFDAVGNADARLQRLLAIRTLKIRVERSHIRAHIAQLEDEIHRFESLAEKGLHPWVGKLLHDEEAVTEQMRPAEVWAEIKKAVRNDGMRQRVRELEDQLSNLLPLAERARSGEGSMNDGPSDSMFWKRVMREMRQTAMARRGSAASMKQARRGSQARGSQAPMDLPRLLTELAAIWAALVNQRSDTDMPRAMTGRMPAQQVLQACLKTFYLRKSGRSKHVEAAVVHLCRCVCDTMLASPKITLFAIMCDIQQPDALEGRLPEFRQDVSLALDLKLLRDLPMDGAHVMGGFVRELKSLRRSRRYPGLVQSSVEDLSDASDPLLPIQLILAAGRSWVSLRSQATCRFFNLTVLGFAEFASLDQDAVAQIFQDELKDEDNQEGADDASLAQPAENLGRVVSEEDEASRMASAISGDPLDHSGLCETVFVSHLIHSYFWQLIASNAESGILTFAQTNEEKEAEVFATLWARLLEEAAGSSKIRRSLGLSEAGSCNVQRVAECLVSWGVVRLNCDIVARSILLAAGIHNIPAVQAEIGQQQFQRLSEAHRKCGLDGGIRCRESIVLWAGLWSLCFERSHEVAQMGTLFELWDKSGDGELQFDEFKEFLQAVAPGISEGDAEELFLNAADDKQGDMTKDVFLSIVLRLGITSDIDTLDSLISNKRSQSKAFSQSVAKT